MNYSVVESPKCHEQLKELGESLDRVDEALCPITFLLALKPEEFPIARGSIRFWKTEALGGLPEMIILFRIDELARRVHLLWVEPINDMV